MTTDKEKDIEIRVTVLSMAMQDVIHGSNPEQTKEIIDRANAFYSFVKGE